MSHTMAQPLAPQNSPAVPAPTAAAAEANVEPESKDAGVQDAGSKAAGSKAAGAAPLNVGNLKHGWYCDPEKQAARLILGKLTDKQHQALAGVEEDAYAYRKLIEAACIEAHGEISLVRAHLIDTATRWYRHGQAAGLWLRSHEDKLDPAQKLAFSKAIAEAAERRDKAVERLDLHKSGRVDPDAIYAQLRANIAQRRLEAQAGAPNDEAANLRPANDEYARPMTPEIAP